MGAGTELKGKSGDGMLETFHLYITSFEQDRLIRVYTPKSYPRGNRRYPVLYMHDGQNVFKDNDAIGGFSLNLENYLDQKELDVIVVAIDQNSEERRNEYCPWINGAYCEKMLGSPQPSGGKGKQYIEFIVNELKPTIETRFRTLKDNTAMAGISLGGLISVYAACRYPDIFKNIAVFSSAFFRNQEEIERLIQTSDLSAIHDIYIDCGTKEGNSESIQQGFLASNRAVYERLKVKSPHVTFETIKDAGHHYKYFEKRVPKLFSFLESAGRE